MLRSWGVVDFLALEPSNTLIHDANGLADTLNTHPGGYKLGAPMQTQQYPENPVAPEPYSHQKELPKPKFEPRTLQNAR